MQWWWLLACRALVGDTGSDRPIDEAPRDTAPEEEVVVSDALVILVSADGLRHDYPERVDTPALDSIAAAGVRAEGLQPIVPTKTFPNHYTQVTGLYAENHGIVDNSFYDPATGESFDMDSTDSHWWGGEPIWVTARWAGLVSATCFWPGSSSEIAGYTPNYTLPYDGSMTYRQRVAQVLEWVDLPPGERPNFITLYFSSPDSAGHSYGPEDEEVDEAVEEVDEMLGDLLEGLQERGLLEQTDLIVVSDHGMSQLSPDRLEVIEADLSRVWASSYSPFGRFDVDEDDVEEVVAALDATEHYSCYAREDTPEDWHYRDNERIADVLCVAEDGWTVGTEDWLQTYGHTYTGGTHGFAPTDAAMHGIFYARGPHFAQGGQVVDGFESVQLYNLLAAALEITPADNDGELSTVAHILAEDAG